MIKKILVLTVLVVFSIISFAQRPMGHPGKTNAPHLKGAFKTFMFFKVVKDSREQLNLNEKQNVELDKILRDVENFTKQLREERSKDNFGNRFVSNSFDPFKFEQERQKRQEEVKNFYLSKIKAVHDLLTKEQRQKLVDIMREKAKNIRSKAKKRMRDMRKWRKDRIGMQRNTPKNY
ncbi:hypothetical protein TTHT_0972 [Thermotomaculum hydrothermale]|uniref:Uncharacterized protein n=1 Tax=Thermotomaculum hydrothermale TaxID=981385 RepID=A0A7R6PF13_9BACT|nr:Spy/CpxP family protein refolding chaperone [Thermotomaculum hydrothermale]BBB32524.1 hypothetical protein TTHT_0972 [Thermotomaculum hydrothermale]